jgi:alkylation response protein AidB-like acyl-CoA dehydrogenase
MPEDNIAEVVAALDELCAVHLTEAYVGHCDTNQSFPYEALEALAKAGWSGVCVPQEYGGDGASMRMLAAVHRTLSRYSLAVGQAFFSMWVLGAQLIARAGTKAQRMEYLPRIVSGKALIGFALTEPEAGSDARALQTIARRAAGGWQVTGQKVFITGAAVSDVIITVVKCDHRSRSAGLSMLLIDPRWPGVSIRRLPKVGLRAIDLCEVFFDDVSVPEEALLGPVGKAWQQLKVGLSGERILLSALCVGALEQLVELCRDHAQHRVAFGRPIGQHQMIGQKIVDMAVDAKASELLCDAAAQAMDANQGADTAASMAKLYAAQAYVTAARDGVQIFGGSGFVDQGPIARHYRDAKYLEIGGGSNEIQRIVIGRSMGLL